MTSTPAQGISQHGQPGEEPSPTSAAARPSVTATPGDLERMKADLHAHQKKFVEARRNRQFKEAASYHKRIIDLRTDLSTSYQFPLAVQLEANLRQAVILLMCEDVDDIDKSLFPDMEAISRQRNSQQSDNILAWSLLCAKVGVLYMRSTKVEDLEKAKEYLNTSLGGLLDLEPAPIKHLFQIGQCLADLYDLTARDEAGAEGMVEWLRQRTGQDIFKNIIIGRISKAIDWGNTNGYKFAEQRFSVSAMEHAIKQNEPKILETMLIFMERNHPSNTLPSRLLLTAAETRNMTMSQLLFEHQAKVDAVDEEGKTVLHRCLYCREPANAHGSKRDGLKIAGFFLSKDASLLNKQDQSGKTALYVACEVGYLEMVSMLLGIEANANLAENNAQTPLYMACERGRRQIVKCLLEKAKDLDIDATGPGGQTPLTVAVQYAAAHAEGRSIVDLLLKKDADPSIKDNTGKTAISYVGGVWASDLKSALKNAKHKSTSPISYDDQDPLSNAVANMSILDKSQRSSRPPSTRTSMFAKMLQPRVRSGTSSLFSHSKTSLDTASRPAASIFSNDMASRRTSFTIASSVALNDNNQALTADTFAADGSSAQFASQKDGGKPSGNDRPDSSRNDDETPTPNQPWREDFDFDVDISSAQGEQHARNPNHQTPEEHADRFQSISADGNMLGHRVSYHSSTDSEYDTPSDSEEASHDGDHSPLEPRMHNIPLESHPSATRERPGGYQDQQSGTIDGASSMPTPPSDHAQGTGSRKSSKGQTQGSSSRGGKVSDSTQTPGAEQKRQVLLACPFAKKDQMTYEHCHTYELKEIKHVKQHLKRCHLIVYCARCREQFPSQPQLERHHRSDDACERSDRPVPEGMTLEQHEILKPRTNHRLSLEEQWYFIWDVLFPGRERPPTPYKDEFINLTEFHKLFKEFRDTEIPILAARLLRELGNATPIAHDQAVFLMREGMLDFVNRIQRSGMIGQNGNATASTLPPRPTLGHHEQLDSIPQSQHHDSIASGYSGAGSQHVAEGHQGSPQEWQSAPPANILGGYNDISSQEGLKPCPVNMSDVGEIDPHRLNSLGDAMGPITPDSSGHVPHGDSPTSTGLSNDEYYQSLQPIDELSNSSSSQRHESVGASQTVDHSLNQAQQSSSQGLAVPQGVPYQTQEWNNAYHTQTLSTAPGVLTGIGTGWNDAIDFGNPSNPLYSPNHLFHMDPSIEQMLDYQMDIDLNMEATQGVLAPPIQTPGYFPAQPLMGGQPMPPNPAISRGPNAAPHQPITQGQNRFSPYSRQPGNGREAPWSTR